MLKPDGRAFLFGDFGLETQIALLLDAIARNIAALSDLSCAVQAERLRDLADEIEPAGTEQPTTRGNLVELIQAAAKRAR